MSSSEKPSPSDIFDSSLKRVAEHANELGEALRAYGRDLPYGPAKWNLMRVATDLEKGRFVESLNNQRSPHRELIRSVVASLADGDSQSALQSTLASIRHYSARRVRIRRGLAYPAFLILVCCVILFFLLGFLTPQFKDLYMEFEIPLPPITLFVLQGQPLFPALFLALIGFIFIGVPLPARMRDRLLHWIPIIGRYRQCNELAVYCRSAAVLLRSGMSVPMVTEQAGLVPGQPMLEDAARSLADAMRKEFPSLAAPYPLVSTVLFALTTDVPSQARTELLNELADIYDERSDKILRWLEATYEPLCAVLLGFMVGCIVFALFVPLVSLIQNLS